jgi:hypothetical protein
VLSEQGVQSRFDPNLFKKFFVKDGKTFTFGDLRAPSGSGMIRMYSSKPCLQNAYETIHKTT